MIDIPSVQDILNNQFLIGGVGTIAIGAVGYVARSVPKRIWSFAETTFSTSFTVTTRYKQYDQIAVLLQRYAIQAVMRNFAPAKSNETNSYYRPKKTNKVPQNLAPGYGSGWAVYQKTLVHFSRSIMDAKSDEIHEKIDIRFFTRDVSIVSRFLHESDGVEDGEFLKLHIQQGDYFGSALRKSRRQLDTVFMAPEVKDRLVDRFAWFLENEKWYQDRGIPYKFCGVLYGPPGTGKTSLVHAIATQFDLAINYVSSLGGLGQLISECTPQDLIVIEDIDALVQEMNREKDRGKVDQDKDGKMGLVDSIILHRLLNAIDGFCTPHGLKVLMTTNYIERLDPALLRPGRTDLMLEIGPLKKPEITTMFRRFYPDAPASYAEKLSDTIEAKGSELQEMFLTKSAEESRDELAKISRISRMRRTA